MRAVYKPATFVKIGTITFAGNSSKLTTSAKTTLRKLAALVKAQGFTSITIDAFTGKNVHGSSAFRKQLSAARAKVVKAYLAAQFTRLHVRVTIKTVAWGAAHPLASGLSAKNRRAEIALQ